MTVPSSSLKSFYLFWITQFFSTLGSSMTSYALSLWIYARTGSALSMSLLSMAASLPVLLAVFAGPAADRFSRKSMILFCDGMAGTATVLLLLFLLQGKLNTGLLFCLCFVQALFNTFQSPASDAAVTQLIRPEDYQKTASLRAFSGSLNFMLAPAAGGFLYISFGLKSVIAFDLASCLLAMSVLALGIPLPEMKKEHGTQTDFRKMFASGLSWLKQHPLISEMMIYMCVVNLINAVYTTALPVLVLNRSFGGDALYSVMKAAGGASMCLCGLVLVFWKTNMNAVQVVPLCILLSFGTECLLLAFSRSAWLYVAAEIIGWASIPLMDASLDLFYRTEVPSGLQGRVFSVRNTIQQAAIPFTSLLTGWLIDSVLEPWMHSVVGLGAALFGTGKGAPAAFLLFLVAVSGAGFSLLYYYRFQKIQQHRIRSPQ